MEIWLIFFSYISKEQASPMGLCVDYEKTEGDKAGASHGNYSAWNLLGNWRCRSLTGVQVPNLESFQVNLPGQPPRLEDWNLLPINELKISLAEFWSPLHTFIKLPKVWILQGQRLYPLKLHVLALGPLCPSTVSMYCISYPHLRRYQLPASLI